MMDDQTEIARRLEALTPLGAGDEQCAECLCYYGVRGMEICRQCIADTPAFTELVGQLMTNSRAAAAIAQEDK